MWHTCHLGRWLTALRLIPGSWAKADMRDQPEMSFLHFGKMPETPPQSHFLPKTPSGDCPGLAGESGARPAGRCGLLRDPRPCHSLFWVPVHGLRANRSIPATPMGPRQHCCRPDHRAPPSRSPGGCPHTALDFVTLTTPQFSSCSRHGPGTQAREWRSRYSCCVYFFGHGGAVCPQCGLGGPWAPCGARDNFLRVGDETW